MKKLTSSVWLFTAAIIWGFAFAAQKAATPVPNFTMTFARSLLATVFLLPIIPLFDKLSHNGRTFFRRGKAPDFNKTELVGGFFCGVALTVGTLLQQAGIKAGTDAGKCAFISVLYVVLVPLLGLILGKKPPARVYFSVPVAVLGFFLLCVGEGFSVALSDLIVLSCALVFAVHITVVGHYSPACDGVRLSCIQFLTETVLTLLCVFLAGEHKAGGFALAWEYGLPILYLGFGSSGIGFTAQVLGQKDAEPAVAAIILSLESVFGALGAWMIFHETMSGTELCGCALVFTAVLLSELDIGSLLLKKKEKDAE